MIRKHSITCYFCTGRQNFLKAKLHSFRVTEDILSAPVTAAEKSSPQLPSLPRSKQRFQALQSHLEHLPTCPGPLLTSKYPPPQLQPLFIV